MVALAADQPIKAALASAKDASVFLSRSNFTPFASKTDISKTTLASIKINNKPSKTTARCLCNSLLILIVDLLRLFDAVFLFIIVS